MKVNDKEEIISFLSSIQPDDFEFIKVNCGTKHKCFGNLNKRPIDDLTGFLFDLSLIRRITSLTLMDGGTKYSSPLVVGTSPSRDGTTNIDADVIEELGLVLKRRIDAECPLTKQYRRGMERVDELVDDMIQEFNAKKKEHDFFNPFTDDLGMP